MAGFCTGGTVVVPKDHGARGLAGTFWLSSNQVRMLHRELADPCTLSQSFRSCHCRPRKNEVFELGELPLSMSLTSLRISTITLLREVLLTRRTAVNWLMDFGRHCNELQDGRLRYCKAVNWLTDSGKLCKELHPSRSRR